MHRLLTLSALLELSGGWSVTQHQPMTARRDGQRSWRRCRAAGLRMALQLKPTLPIDEEAVSAFSRDRIGVLLLNLGGPDTLDNVEPFLYNLFSDPEIVTLPS